MSFKVGKKSFNSLSDAVKYSHKNSKSDKPIKFPDSTVEYDCTKRFLCDLSGQEDSELVFVKKVNTSIVTSSCKINISNLKFTLSGSSLVFPSGSVIKFKDCVFEKDDGENKLLLEGEATFEGCKFEKVYVVLSKTSKVTFTDCEFKEDTDVEDQETAGIYTESLEQTFKKCSFSGFNKAILASAAFVPIQLNLEECNFKAPDNATAQIIMCPKDPESIEIVKENKFGEKLKLNYAGCSLLSMRKTQIIGGKGGLDIYGAVASIDTVKIQVTEKGAIFVKSYLILTKLRVQGKLKPDSVGVSIDGPCTSKITEGLYMGMAQGINVVCERKTPTKHLLKNVAFVSNRVGLTIKNAQTEVGGCLFTNNREYSMSVDVDKKEINSLKVNRDPILSFWYNNYCEKQPGVKECDNEYVWNNVRDPHPFKYTTEGEHMLYINHLYERLVRGYLDLEFRSKISQKTKGDVGVRSVKMLMKLMKQLREPIIDDIKKNPRLGAFLARRKIDEATLLKPSEIFESWHTLRNLKLFLDVFDGLKELKNLQVITHEEYTEELKKIRQTFLNVLIKSSHARKLEFLTTLTETRPLNVLWYLDKFGRKEIYSDVEDVDELYEENMVVKFKVLVHMFTLIQSPAYFVDIDVTWLHYFALQQLIEDLDFHKTPDRKVPYSISHFWVEALFQTSALKNTKTARKTGANHARNDMFMAYELMLSGNASLENPQVQGLIERMSDSIGPTAQIPFFLRKLLKFGTLGSAFKIYSLLNVHLSVREEFGNKILWQFLVDQKKYKSSGKFKVFDDGHCQNCKRFILGPELMQAKYCDDPKYVYCRRCFKKLAERKTGDQYGTCPGSGVLLDNADLSLAEIDESYRERAANFHLKKYKKTLKVWYRCVIEDCRGGSDKLEKKMFTCELCGMFGQVDKYGNVDVSLRLPKDFTAVWLICVLFKKAVEGSRHIEHYFPYGYAPRYLLNGRGAPDKVALGRISEPIPNDSKNLGKIKNPVTVGLMNFIMATCPTTVRLLPEAPKVIAKMKGKKDDFYRYNTYNYNNRNKPDPGFERKEFWLQIQSNQEKEIAFQKGKAKKGAYYAWHGSGIFNWHSIIRVGLKNMSNTKYMSAGAAYGAGIYHSPQFLTAAGYSANRGAYGATNKPQIEMYGIAVVECVNDKVKKSGTIYVAQEEKYMQIRYVMIVMFIPKSK